MPTSRETVFTGYDFTDEELIAAQVFPDLNEKYLQNEMCIAAESKVSVVFDPEKPELAKLQTAYYNGQIDILKFVLGVSKDRKSELQAHLEELAGRQAADGKK